MDRAFGMRLRLTPWRLAALALIVTFALAVLQGAIGADGRWQLVALPACAMAIFAALWWGLWQRAGAVGRWILALSLGVGAVLGPGLLILTLLEGEVDARGQEWITILSATVTGGIWALGLLVTALAWLAGSRRAAGVQPPLR